ncbi:extracellular solute-binding protein [Sinorhizobium meliloti]|nr:extracellular solute-binding protein [Sinorhizobium meliloti]
MLRTSITNILAATALVFTTMPTAHAQEEMTLRLTTANSYMKPIYEQIASEFKEQHPNVRIEVDASVTSWEEQLQRTLRGGITGDLPDISEQSYNLFHQVVDRGFAQPLTPFMNAAGNMASLGYGPALINLGGYKGQSWGLPMRMSVPIMYFNADLIREAGGDPKNLPDSWGGLIALAAKITKLKDGNMGMFYEYEADGAWLFLTLINLQGARPMSDDDKTIAFDGPTGLRALQILSDIGKSGMVDMPRSQARQAFSAGTIGFLVGSGSQIAKYQEQSKGRFELGTASLPPLGANPRLPVGGGLLLVNADRPEREKMAWEFVKYATGPSAQTLLVKETGMMPANDIPGTREDMLGKFYEENPLHRPNLEQLPMVTDWFTFPGENSVKITDAIRERMRSVVTQAESPQDALKAMVRDVKELLPAN